MERLQLERLHLPLGQGRPARGVQPQGDRVARGHAERRRARALAAEAGRLGAEAGLLRRSEGAGGRFPGDRCAGQSFA